MNLSVKKVVVRLNEKTVGYLAELSSGEVAFQYDSNFLEYGFPISPFSLPLSNKMFICRKPLLDGLFGVFYDSLPDGWGKLTAIRYLQTKGINYHNLSPLTKLTLIGNCGLGGLQYEPIQNENELSNDVDLNEIAKNVQLVLKEQSLEESSLDEIFLLGGSSGGARPKAHVKMGGVEWIVKFPCAIDPENVGEKEYVANMLAVDCGINVAEFSLLPSNTSSGYFASKRFDRVGDRRLHVISLSSLLETSHRTPNLDYMHLFQVIESISSDKGDVMECFRRLCFNVFYKNRDDHGKNFAFIYYPNVGYRLSPAYDITATPFKSEHEMTVLGKGNPTEKDILLLAEELKLPIGECKAIISRVKSTIDK